MSPASPPPRRLTGEQRYRIAYPRAIRLLFVFAGCMCLLLAIFGWMAYREDGVQVGLILGIPFGIGGVFWFYALARSPFQVDFFGDHLVAHRWGRQDRLDYAAISGLTVTRRRIILHRAGPVADGDLRLHKHHANADAMLVNALEALVPALHARREERLHRVLPFTVTHKWGFPLGMAMAGLIFLCVGGLTLAFAGQASLWTADWFARAGMGALFLLFGLLFLYITVWDAVLDFTFRADEIRVRHLLRARSLPTHGLTAIRQIAAPTTVRGVPRTQYHIELTYADGSTQKLSPNAASFPSDYIDAEEQAATAELAEALRAVYLTSPLTTPMPPMPPMPPMSPMSPVIRAVHTAPDFGFTLRVEDHSPDRAGHHVIHMVAEPPLAGVGHFLTADGSGFIDPTGRFVVIHDDRLIIVFDLAEERPYHMHAPRGGRLVNVAHEVGYVTFDTVGRSGGDPVPGRVLSLDPISRRLRPGLGTAKNGVLPSLSPLKP